MEFFSNLTEFLSGVITQTQNIAPILAATAFVVFALMYAFGGQQASQMAKTRGVQVVVGLLIVWGVSALVNTMIDLTGKQGDIDKLNLSINYFLPYLKATLNSITTGLPF